MIAQLEIEDRNGGLGLKGVARGGIQKGRGKEKGQQHLYGCIGGKL